MSPKNLGISGWDTYEFIVRDLDRSRRFYANMMDIAETARLSDKEKESSGEDASFYGAGNASFVVRSPKLDDSASDRWLNRHPDGVSIISYRVRDLDFTRKTLEQRGATFVNKIVAATDYAGQPYRYFDIATPLGEVRFRFVERHRDALPPGFVPLDDAAQHNRLGFQVIDHVTSNFLTIGPHVGWLRDVMGMEEYWRVHFHTADMQDDDCGSGLASTVMWDSESGCKLANNEPAAPNYEASQIYKFVVDNNGPGVQHIAFHVPQIIPAVEGLRRNGIDFLDTPATYYDMLPERMVKQRVPTIEENVDDLKRLGILVDGSDERYLLQIFMVEGGLLYDDRGAGPFFYEVIERHGARGFGEGNFRALFEAIERDQYNREIARKQLEAGAGS